MNSDHNIPDPRTLTPAPLRNRLRAVLDAPAAEVWALVGDLARMPEYSAGLDRVAVKQGADGKPSEFVCHFKPMKTGAAGVAHRNLIHWYEPSRGWMSKDEEPNDFGLKGSVHRVTLAPSREGTLVTWDAHYDAADLEMQRTGLDEALADIADRLVARFGGRVIERYADGARAGMDGEVIRAVEKMTDAFHRADLGAVLAAYEPGAAVAFEPGKLVSGEAALRDGFQTFFAFKPRFTYGGHEVLVSGDSALHFAPWTMTGGAPDGQAVKQNGLSVALLRRGLDGEWKLVIDNPYGGRLLEKSAQSQMSRD